MSVLSRTPTKMKIGAYYDRERLSPFEKMDVMYNPESIELNCHMEYAPNNFINTHQRSNRYVQTQPEDISLELLFDAQMPGNRYSINDRVAALQRMCCNVNPSTNEPYYLRLQWGEMRWMTRHNFDGRVSQFRVRYTLFNKRGEALRAIVTLVVIADESLTLQKGLETQESPESWVVRMPDNTSFPALVNDVTHSSSNKDDYLTIAMVNNLDSTDAVRPGEDVSFTKLKPLVRDSRTIARNDTYRVNAGKNREIRRVR